MQADLWLLGNVLGTESDDADSLHGGVREASIAGELRQTLDSVLEGGYGGQEVLAEDQIWRVEGRSGKRCHQSTGWEASSEVYADTHTNCHTSDYNTAPFVGKKSEFKC